MMRGGLNVVPDSLTTSLQFFFDPLVGVAVYFAASVSLI